MAHDEDLENSLPYIDDLQTDDETTITQGPYNLRIIENYQNRNRNIEITNRYSDEVVSKSLSPVAPLAEDSELSDVKLSEEEREEEEEEGEREENTCKHLSTSLVPGQSGMKLVIKGWNSTIKIQGLDNKSSIVFKRKSEQNHEDKAMKREKANGSLDRVPDGSKNQEKSRKGRWKMLTKSLITKSARFERRGLDERYPKYVLLKDEEEEDDRRRGVEEESYPKMVFLKEKRSKEVLSSDKENVKTIKSEFNFKKSFKNKTKPVVSMEDLLGERDTRTTEKMAPKEPEIQKRPLTERRSSEKRNLTLKKKVIVERRKSFAVQPEPEMMFNVTGYPPPQGQVFNEIQGIFEDTLNLSNSKGKHPDCIPKGDPRQPEPFFPSQTQPEQYYTSIPPQYCQFPCNNPCCHPSLDQPPVYIPVYNPYSKPGHVYKHSNTQTNENELKAPPPAPPPPPVLEESTKDKDQVEDLHLESLPFGLLSSFFPRVVIMKTFQTDDLGVEGEVSDDTKGDKLTDFQSFTTDQKQPEDELKILTTLEVPQPDLQLKSKMIPLDTKPESEDFQRDSHYLTLNDVSIISDDEHKTKTDDSETTEYLNFNDNDSPNNDTTNPTPTWKDTSKPEKGEKVEREDGKTLQKQNTDDDDENGKNLSLTKIGYKMYDNLTKLSLKREKEINEKPEVSGRGSNGSETKKSPCAITLESNNRIIKVTVPENELSFQIVDSEGPGIQIGVTSTSDNNDGRQEKMIVDRSELWHPNNGKKRPSESAELQTKKSPKDSQKIRLSLADNKEVVLSIETNENDRKQETATQKFTKEMKVGTDDFDLAGGDFPGHFGTNYKNLSPRTGKLLRSLQEKLEFGERERRFLAEKIREQFLDRKFEEGLLPGVFLVRQISPRANVPKKPSEVPSLRKPTKIQGIRNESRGQLREYYCEECLATMRIFEDENPSVKSMVDKFETIIQLESY